MLKSMTGFGSGTVENDAYKVQAEVKALNQRYLDIDFHAARELMPWEDAIRNVLKKYAARGKLSVYITVTDKREGQVSVEIKRELAQAYQAAYTQLAHDLGIKGKLKLRDLLKLPNLVQANETDSDDACEEVLLSAVDKAAAELEKMRLKEGEHLRQDFLRRLTDIEKMIGNLEALAPEIVNAYRERLQKFVDGVLTATEIDETRIVQETAVFADRVNFTEEIVRLKSHIVKFRDLMDLDEPLGRKLDFLLQEMNREANTIGSKANNSSAAHIVVDIKSEIEKIREQVQNIE